MKLLVCFIYPLAKASGYINTELIMLNIEWNKNSFLNQILYISHTADQVHSSQHYTTLRT